MNYGQPPVKVEQIDIEWTEVMRYLYLPISIPEQRKASPSDCLPSNLQHLQVLIERACEDYQTLTDRPRDHELHIYLTVKRGYTGPDQPSNRLGLHCDGFATNDVNYIWWDKWGTRFAEQDFGIVSSDHAHSLKQFEWRASNIVTYPDSTLYRLNPYVVHTTPDVPSPGGIRSFVKISFSKHQYNLIGNSHNYLLDYDWKMYDRSVVRNDPHCAQNDFFEKCPEDGCDQPAHHNYSSDWAKARHDFDPMEHPNRYWPGEETSVPSA